MSCEYCASRAEHPSFVSLLFDSRLTPAEMLAPGGMPPSSYVFDYSRQPLVNLCCHRRQRRYRIGPKATKHNAPHWQLAVVIGPFYGGACLFVRLLKARCRRWRQKLKGCVALAQAWPALDAKRQRGRPVRVFHADIEGHREMFESVLQEEEDGTERLALEQAARALIASSS